MPLTTLFLLEPFQLGPCFSNPPTISPSDIHSEERSAFVHSQKRRKVQNNIHIYLFRYIRHYNYDRHDAQPSRSRKSSYRSRSPHTVCSADFILCRGPFSTTSHHCGAQRRALLQAGHHQNTIWPRMAAVKGKDDLENWPTLSHHPPLSQSPEHPSFVEAPLLTKNSHNSPAFVHRALCAWLFRAAPDFPPGAISWPTLRGQKS